MNSSIPAPVTEYLPRYRNALDILVDLGVKVKGTRLQTYEVTLTKFADVDANKLHNDGNLERYIQSLFEASEIVDVCSLPIEVLGSDQARDRLHKISGGREFAIEYGPHDHDAARDAVFEFTAAAFLYSQSSLKEFSRFGGDLVVDNNGCFRPAECKRLSSIGALSGRLRKVSSKLRSLHTDGGQAPGIGMLDLSLAIRSHANIIHAKSEDELRDIVDSIFKGFAFEHRGIIQKDIRRKPWLLGLAVRVSFVGIVGSLENLRRYRTWQYFHIHEGDHVEGQLFRDVVEGLGPQLIVPHIDAVPSLEVAIRTNLFPRMEDYLRPLTEAQQATELDVWLAKQNALFPALRRDLVGPMAIDP